MSKLAALPVSAFLEVLAEGMTLIAEHVATLETAAGVLQATETARAAEAIRVISDEEAGKFLILLDAVRAARRPQGVKSKQLKLASNHIAKGIYARAPDINPASYEEVLSFAEHLRRTHYLDGPNDVDWIFRNVIEAEREERLYVDYVESDDGDMWISPQRFDDYGPRYPSGAVELVGALSRAGFCDARTLAVVADVWRDFRPVAETHWAENEQLTRATLDQVPAETVDATLVEADVRRIIRSWTFPLVEAELCPIREDVEGLREQQRNWAPDGFGGDYY
jgi:AbiV family abortive infection protein